MHDHLLRPAIVAAGLTVVAVCAAGTATAQTAGHPATPAVARAAARAVFLATGDQLATDAVGGPGCVEVVSFGTRAPASGRLQTLHVGDSTFAFPADAAAYLGRGLDPSLFDVTAVAAAESAGRLPVRVHYSGRLPSLPGVTITRSGGGIADGYLTQAGAVRFGAALARQFAAAQAPGRNERNGIFAGRVSLALAGARPAARQPASVTHTVTVTGTDIGGQPAGSDDVVFVFNADDSARFDNLQTSASSFTDGVAKFRVPAGHYWAVGDFVKPLPRQHSWDEYLDVLPQFTVSGNTTVHVGAAAATSEVQAVISRRVTEQTATFELIRSAAAGPAVSMGWLLADGGPKIPAPSLYISPTQASPTVGKLAAITTEQLGPAAFQSDSRYLYDLAYQSSGTITGQRHVVNQAALATVHLRYYSAAGSWGLSGTFPRFPVNKVCELGGAIFGGMHFPAQQTVYLLVSPSLSWQTQYIQNAAQDYSGGQIGPFQAFVPGEHQTQDFGAYPLHPAVNVRLSDIAGLPPVQVSAGRAGNTLRLAVTAFSDSVPGHVAQGTFPPVQTAASYEIEQNGTKIAGGAVPEFYGPFAATATLSPSPSVIRFTLNASEGPRLNPLSTASHTAWTWRSAPGSGGMLPAGWTCLPGGVADRACVVEPMMTLRYNVVGLGLDGSTNRGQQVVRVLVGHLQLARAAKVIRTAVSVSFDGGKTWQAARVTGGGGSYAAVFSAPAGALVTLRTNAADAAGDSITETIVNAYQVAS